MIPSRAETHRAIHGALLLARGDFRGMDGFDLSVEGFWNSFAGPVLAAPLYFLILAQQYVASGDEDGLGWLLFGKVLAYALDAVTFPVLAIFVTLFLGLGTRYVPLVVATNWAALPQLAASLAAVTLGGLLPPLRPSLVLVVLLGSFAYQWFIIRTALGSSNSMATAILILNLLVGLLASEALDWALQLG